MIAITICATKSYTYAMRAQARRVVANITAARIQHWHGCVVLVGDESKELKSVAEAYKNLLPEGWTVTLIGNKALVEGGTNYKEQAQLLIAAMRSEAFAYCRKIGVPRVWSLDSDVLPPANALRCMLNTLEFDDGLWSVATCPYPNSAFLGGFGTPQNPIAEDFLPHERKLPWHLKRAFEACEKRLKGITTPYWHCFTNWKRRGIDDPRKWAFAEWRHAPDQTVGAPPAEYATRKAAAIEREQKRMERLRERVKKCPPDGNIWEVIAKHGWRRRGWLDNTYPGLGRGAVLPSDWCGFGCTLMNGEALALADFEGYDGKGTEDLFVCWRRWYPARIEINVITHCPCDHVIWEKKKGGDGGKYTHHVAYHETEGEYRGHLRVRQLPWIPEAA